MVNIQRVPVEQLGGAKEGVAKSLTDWHFSVEANAESDESEVWRLTKNVDGLDLELTIDPQARRVSLIPNDDNKLSEIFCIDLEPGRIIFLGIAGDCWFISNDGSTRFSRPPKEYF